jgi:hypothetical protein
VSSEEVEHGARGQSPMKESQRSGQQKPMKKKPAGLCAGCLPSPADTPWILLSMEAVCPEVYP